MQRKSYEGRVVSQRNESTLKFGFCPTPQVIFRWLILLLTVSVLASPSAACVGSCCCGKNLVYADTPYPHLSWAIQDNGHFSRLWWNQTNHQEQVDFDASNSPLVSGSLHRDPFGDGVIALTERGEIVAVVKNSAGNWETELVLPRLLRRMGGVRPCLLTTTTEGSYASIWAVAGDWMLRIYRDSGGAWRSSSVGLGEHGPRIAPSSLYASHEGQVAGTLKNGRQWVIWHQDGDPDKMRFDYGAGRGIVVAPEPNCEPDDP